MVVAAVLEGHAGRVSDHAIIKNMEKFSVCLDEIIIEDCSHLN